MKLHIVCIFITLLALREITTDVLASSLLSQDPFRGISPEDEKYYKSDVIKCKDGSGKFTRAQLNDDFCDCIDGTDEPGTSACSGGKFYCRNTGHTPMLLFSSRVNDGICDCCDGSDEYDGIVKCPNTCWEAGKVARDKLKKKISTYQEGVTVRKNEIEQAKLAIAKDEEELTKLKKEEKVLKDIVQQLKERKEEIEKAEEKERIQKEIEEKERKEGEEKANGDQAKTEVETELEKKEEETPAETKDEDKESMDHEKIGQVEENPSDENVVKDHGDLPNVAEGAADTGTDKELLDNSAEQHVVGDKGKPISLTQKEESAITSETAQEAGREEPSGEIQTEGNDVSENTEGLSKEELGRLVASRWTGEKAEKDNKEGTAESYDDHEDMPNDAHDEDDDGYVSKTDDDIDDKKYEYDDDPEGEESSDLPEEYHDDHSSSHDPESNDDIDLSDISPDSNPSWLEKIQKSVRNILKAVNLIKTPVDKSEADQVRKEYESSSSKLSKIQSRISKLSEKSKLDFGREKEFYSFHGRCFESKQNKYIYKVCPFKDATQEEGYSKTRLGSWDKFDDSYRVMIFANGDKCWNGPDRSLKVKLRCGLTNEVTDVDEPSRCEYVALLSTPALCLEDKLMELRQKLDLMNKEQPSGHDEL